MATDILLATSLFGSNFYADANPNWLKIDGVTIGESDQFGHSSVVAGPGGIGQLLQDVLQDPSVVVVIFHWESNTAWLKTGFTVNDPSDSKQNGGCTTFIATNRIQPEFVGMPPNTFSTPQARQLQTPPAPSMQLTPKPDFVHWNPTNSQFELSGTRFVPVGFNSYWFGLMEDFSYPSESQITEMFQLAIQIDATVIRSHTLGMSSGTPHSLFPGASNPSTDGYIQLNPDAWHSIDFTLAQAAHFGIKLICPLLDTYNYYHGNYGDFCKNRGLDKSQFWTHPQPREDFKSYLTQYLNHTNPLTGLQLKNDPSILFLELGNELGNIRPEAGSTAIPPQSWFQEMTSHIRTLDDSHMIFNGTDECLGSSVSNEFSVSQIDCFGAHFYEHDYDRLNRGASCAAALNKPYVIGEYDSKFGRDWFSRIEGNRNIHGSIFWGMYPSKSGVAGSEPLLHEDGFTLNWGEKDAKQLEALRNHHRRMRGMPALLFGQETPKAFGKAMKGLKLDRWF
ncbi:hypothetical protein HDU98_001583 [Podochytrium sp. JEL0797]|nr:hypothetical protein HDU98_001583 [Podochytrium sp. JEL0797]